MKKLFLVLVFIVSMATVGFSQESSVYTFFVNVIRKENFSFPLIGFSNVSLNNQILPQIGFVNYNHGNFKSLQLGFINGIKGDMDGTQIGFVNYTGGNFRGPQIGFVNVAAKSFSGVQLGFINYIDTLESGVPIGFLSIVRNGGYKAVEYNFSEFYPITLGLKLGVEKFYTTIFTAYNPSGNDFALGFGLGSILTINESFFFNPELNQLSPGAFDGDNQNVTGFIPYFGYNINKNFSIVAGPSVTWVNGDTGNLPEPVFKIYHHKINDNNSIVVGARAGVRLRF